MPDVRVGDEVVLVGKQGDDEITLEEVVAIRGTDLQEVCQSVRKHIARLYFRAGRPFKLITPVEEFSFESGSIYGG